MSDTTVVVTHIGAGTITIEDGNAAVVSPTTVQPTVTVDAQTTNVQVVSDPAPSLTIEQATMPLTLTEESTDLVEVISAGPQGPPGPQGADGASGDLSYTHNQGTPSSVWTITHNLGKMPAVVIVDSADNVVVGDVHYVDNNSVTVTFTAGFSGKAYLN